MVQLMGMALVLEVALAMAKAPRMALSTDMPLPSILVLAMATILTLAMRLAQATALAPATARTTAMAMVKFSRLATMLANVATTARLSSSLQNSTVDLPLYTVTAQDFLFECLSTGSTCCNT